MLIHILHTLANIMQSWMWLCNLTIFLHNMLDILHICCQSTPKLVMAWDFVIATRQPGSSLRMCYQVQIWGWAHHIFKFVIWCHSDPYELHQTQIYYFKYLKQWKGRGIFASPRELWWIIFNFSSFSVLQIVFQIGVGVVTLAWRGSVKIRTWPVARPSSL